MRTLWLLWLSPLALGACGPLVEPEEAPLARSEQAVIVDADADGIDDVLEDQLAAKFAPEVRLSPDSIDWTRPANVDWYLARVHMRFDHDGCPDCEVLALATPTQANLSTQSHKLKSGLLCGHNSTAYASKDSHKEFFLQPEDDNVHKGAPSSGWRIYVHTKKSALVTGGYNLQYWFFYPYNDSVASVNHEADWEHITVTTDAAGAFYSAWYAQHNGGVRYSASQLKFNGTHPIVYSADGSHASYPSVGEWDLILGQKDHTYDGGPVWPTWNNWVNVGEKGAPRNNQVFIKYGGRWGEVGGLEDTSGPQGPSFQGSWTTY